MNEDAKRIIPGGLLIKSPVSEDRIPSSVAATPPDKRAIIKSADMLPDVQKEAIDTAIAVSAPLWYFILYIQIRGSFLFYFIFIEKKIVFNMRDWIPLGIWEARCGEGRCGAH